MELTVDLTDVKRIGHTTYQSCEGNTIFVCSLITSNIEEILLRNILKCFHKEYSIIDIDDYDKNNVNIRTNLPWDLYMEI